MASWLGYAVTAAALDLRIGSLSATPFGFAAFDCPLRLHILLVVLSALLDVFLMMGFSDDTPDFRFKQKLVTVACQYRPDPVITKIPDSAPQGWNSKEGSRRQMQKSITVWISTEEMRLQPSTGHHQTAVQVVCC